MEFEEIIHSVGGYGKYQKLLTWLFLLPVTTFIPWLIMTKIFLVSVPDHWCHIPELADTHLNLSEKLLMTSPPENSQCLMYNFRYENTSYLINSTYNDNALVSCKYGWDYDKTDYESTAATKWNLVCDKSHYSSLILILMNVGGIFGAPIYSSFSDKFGRKKAYILVALVTTVCNFLSPFAEDFITFAVLRTLNSSIYPNILILPYIIVMEIIPPEKRTQTSYVWNFGWVVGMCELTLVVYLSRNWKNLCWICSVAGLITLIYARYIPESARWLVSQKRYEEAKDMMLQIASRNGHEPNTKNILSDLQTLGEKIELEEKEKKRSFSLIIKSPRLRKYFLILTANGMANQTIYCVIHYNILNLEGNEFLTFLMLSVAEFPGVFILWFLMERVGRRWSATGGFIVCGIVCAVPILGLKYSTIVCSVIGKLIVIGLFMVCDQQLCELYPTVYRSFAMGASKSISFGITFFLPYIAYLSIYGKYIPFAFISVTCFLVGITSSFLPETSGKNLPQTVADAEEFGKDQKYFSFKKCPKTQLG